MSRKRRRVARDQRTKPRKRLRRIALIGLALGVLAVAGGAAVVFGFYGLTPGFFAQKVLRKAELDMPWLSRPLAGVLGLLGLERAGRAERDGIVFPRREDWSGPEAGVYFYDDGSGDPSRMRRVEVRTPAQVVEAIRIAEPGDVITLGAGVYPIAGKSFPIQRAGTADRPIVLRAERAGDVRIEFDALVGFLVQAPHWVFENLDIRGVCPRHDECEHAFHIVGEARWTVVRNNRIRDFNAAIKGNGLETATGQVFPDHVLIEGNRIYNTTVRNTGNPVTPIDVVGASGWIVRANLIADFVKIGGNRISYGAFFKGNSRDCVFERNLVVCEMNLLAGRSTQLGLSFGGGGSGDSPLCRDHTCIPEHHGGVMKNNIVLHCNDAGIHLNRSRHTAVMNNTLFNTLGIDARFPETNAYIQNNLMSGSIQARDGATSLREHNQTGVGRQDFLDWFENPAVADFRLTEGGSIVDRAVRVPAVDEDFCGTPRDDRFPDVGAIEYADGRVCDVAGLYALPPPG